MYSILNINADFQGGLAPLLLMFRGALAPVAPVVPTPVLFSHVNAASASSSSVVQIAAPSITAGIIQGMTPSCNHAKGEFVNKRFKKYIFIINFQICFICLFFFQTS